MPIIKPLNPLKYAQLVNYAFKAALALILSVSLSSCSILETLYENSPQLVFWWLDGYLDFKSEQVPRVKEELRALQKWHRETQLPQVLSWVQELLPMTPLDLTSEQTCGFEKKFLQTLPETIARLAPSIAKIAPSLNAEQLKALQSNFELKNKDWSKEWMSGTPHEQLDHLTEKGLEQAKDMYGRVTNAQKLELRNLAQRSGFDPAKSMGIKLYRQEETLKALEKIRLLKLKGDLSPEGPGKETERIVLDWLNNAYHIKDPELLRYSEQRLQFNCEAVALFHNKTTPEQRVKARNKIGFYESVMLKLLKNI
jgi:HPt (histidine-containing phosphotransfer) domain-containing protein